MSTVHELLTNLFISLKQLEFYPKHIIDVGANYGSWSRIARQHYPESFLTMVEPQGDLKIQVRDLLVDKDRVDYYPVGAGNRSGKLKFTLHKRHDSCSFALSEADAAARNFKQIEVDVMTLNEICSNSRFPLPELIKIDAEGFDLEVLEGASELFKTAEVFLVEASVSNPRYKNTVSRVIDAMHKKGYQLFDITQLNRPMAVKLLWLVELVFIRTGGRVDQKLKAVQGIPQSKIPSQDALDLIL